MAASYETSIDLQQQNGTAYTYDPVSEGVIQGIPRVHQSHLKLKETVNQNLVGVVQACQTNRVSLTSALSYEQFLAGLLFKDEQMLVSGQFLYYTNVVFQPVTEDDGKSDAKKNMTQGRAFLTNHRIILLSAEKSQGLTFSELGIKGVDNKPSSYTLGSRSSDVLHYQSIPLGCVKNVELNASCGVSTNAIINGHRPALICRMFSCLQMDMCLKSWVQESLTSSAVSQRILTIGATLPPWGQKYMVQIHVKEDIQLELVKNFVVDLQHFAPDLYTGAMNRKE